MTAAVGFCGSFSFGCSRKQSSRSGALQRVFPVDIARGMDMSAWRQVFRAGMVLAFPCVAAAADDFPHRQAGSWETTIVVNGKSVTTQQCVGDATDKLINAMQAPAGGTCSKRTLEKTSDGYSFEYACKIGAVSMEGKSVLTGDLDSAFKLESTSVRTGTPNQPGPVSRTVSATARRLGPC